MKEYTKEFDGVTYTFTEGDLYGYSRYILNELREDISKAKKLMGSYYTEEVDTKVQSLIDDYIVFSFKSQESLAYYINTHGRDITPQFAVNYAQNLGNFARDYTRGCNVMQNCIADDLRKIGVPVCKRPLGN
mgnify:CR=1 FL=1